MENAPLKFETRFLKPAGFVFNHFITDDGVRLRYGVIRPEGQVRGHIILLHGFSEFIEKYFETITDFIAEGYAVYSFDWRGQGRSDRHFEDLPERVYSQGFGKDVAHLKSFMTQIVGDVQPRYLFAHSMGGHIALRYLHDQPHAVKAAILSAPMMGFNLPLPRPLARILLKTLHLLRLDHHDATRDAHWSRKRPPLEEDPRSKDPVRRLVHYMWCEQDTAYRLGNISLGWVYQALRSVIHMEHDGYLEEITTPLLIGVAGHEKIVDNKAIYQAATRLPSVELIELDTAEHELLMERDPIRSVFLQRCFAFIKAQD